MTRSELSFDGWGINGPDEYRSRVATFASETVAEKYGPLFAAAPNLLEELETLAIVLEEIHADMGRHNCTVDCPDIGKHVRNARDLIAKAKGDRQPFATVMEQGMQGQTISDEELGKSRQPAPADSGRSTARLPGGLG